MNTTKQTIVQNKSRSIIFFREPHINISTDSVVLKLDLKLQFTIKLAAEIHDGIIAIKLHNRD